VQLSATIAVNSIVLGIEQSTKSSVMYEKGIDALLALASGSSRNSKDGNEDRNVVASSIYALGSIVENEDVRAQVVEMHGIAIVVKQANVGDIEIKRAAGYFLATICQQVNQFIYLFIYLFINIQYIVQSVNL
jgi:hypothetical protein